MFLEPKKVYGYFSSNFSLVKSTKGWWNMCCPFCGGIEGSKKMAVNPIYGWVKCWVCGYSGSSVTFVCDYAGVMYWEARSIIREASSVYIDLEIETETLVISSIALPEGYCPILTGTGAMAKRARSYLTNRGFDLSELASLGVGYCNTESEDDLLNYFGYIIVPFKSKGKLVYYLGRDYIGNFLRYKNPPRDFVGVGKSEIIFNEDALNINDLVFITEGWTDAVTLGLNGIATLGWSLGNVQYSKIIRSNCLDLCLVPDAGMDGTGKSFYTKALELAIKLIAYKRIKVLDLNIFGEDADPNSVGRYEIMNLYRSSDYEDLTTLTRKLLS